MKPRDILLAVLVSAIWGSTFVIAKIGLESFSAPQLTVLRFIIACLPVLVLPRPPVGWRMLFATGMTLFTGQFLLLFLAYQNGVPPGLASVTQQLQAFFTVALAALFLREVPTVRQSIGIALAFFGLALIGFTSGADLTPLGFVLVIAAPLSWAIGNIFVKRMPDVPMLPLMAWLSLVPPIPSLLVSLWLDNASLWGALAHASWASLAAVIYLGAIATTVVYAIWGGLLGRYPAAIVAPFALVAPCVGVISSAIVFDEVFPPIRYAGMALIMAGLAIIVLRTKPAITPSR